MSAHTPGPWWVEGGLHRRYYRAISAAGWGALADVVVRMSGSYDKVRKDAEGEANARLIAESPTMLEALQTIMANATVIPDPQMQGTTDCYRVPLDDIEAIKIIVERIRKTGGTK